MISASKLLVLFLFILESKAVPLPSQANHFRPKPVKLAHDCLTVHSTLTDNHDGTPILLVHGLGVSKESWSGIYQVLALTTGRKVCVADLRNHGDSPWNDEGDVAAMAEDINLLLDTLNTSKIIILGHSLGGKVTVHFTLNYPEKVQKMIIEDMRPNSVTESATKMVQSIMGMLDQVLTVIPEGSDEKAAKKAVGEYLVKFLNLSDLTELDPDILPIKCVNGKCSWKTNTKLMGKYLNDPASFLTESTGLYEGPSLFIYGKASPFKVDEDEKSILELFPKAKLVGIEGAGHNVHADRKFLDEVIKFIKQ